MKREAETSNTARQTAESLLQKASFDKRQLLQKIDQLEEDIQALEDKN